MSVQTTAAAGSLETAQRAYAAWRPRIYWTLWFTYGAFYICRQNLGIALPGIMGEFGWTKATAGVIATTLFWAYAAGQFINGQLVDKYGGRLILPIGILASALMNFLVGTTAGFGTLAGFMILWGINGYFQAMGWPSCIKTLANWFSPKERGKRMGVFGASYQVGGVVAALLAGFLVARFGWRAGFWVPALIFALFAAISYFGIRSRPEVLGLPPLEEFEGYASGEAKAAPVAKPAGPVKEEEHLGFRYTLGKTVGNPRVWLVAFSFFFVDIIRYGFVLWAPTYLFETQGATISRAAYTSAAVPLFGIAGAILAGWSTDRFFQSRRAPVVTILMAALGVLAWSYYYLVPQGAWVLNFIILGLVGFCVMGSQVTLVGAVPMDFGTRKSAASAAGFIDMMGYIGAGLTAVVGGWLTDTYGWGTTFNFWIFAAFASAAIAGTLWFYKPPKGKYI